ncbi:MAG TPA: hypothetical protein VF519_06670 [Mycobacteriales bacterium]
MSRAEVERLLDDVFDGALLTHGFDDHARDYVMEFERMDGQRVRYAFRHCVSARVTTALSPAIWARSLDPAAEPGDYVWGVRWQCVYPGGSVVEPSEEAARWSAEVGVPFTEVRIEANAHVVELVFTTLEVVA